MTAADPVCVEPAPGDRVAPHDVHPAARNPAPPAAYHETARIGAAALAARRRYPGPVGEVLARELGDWALFGWRVGGNGLISRLVDDLMSPQ